MSRDLIQHLNIPICRCKLGVRALNNAHVISEPFRYLENTDASCSEITGEAMAHDVRRYPAKILGLHEICVRSAEVPSVTKPSLFDCRTKHPLVSLTIFQKSIKKAPKAPGS